MKYDVCIYHANCYDGFTAAWIANRWGGVLDLQPFDYGQTLPVEYYEGKHVLIADFSFEAQTLRNLAQYAASVTVLDHHKSAAEQLAEFEWHENWDGSTGNIRVKFDMEQSGAMLTWKHLAKGGNRLVEYVQDRDLWKFELTNSKDINAYIMSHDYDLRIWDSLHDGFKAGMSEWQRMSSVGLRLNGQLQLDIRRALVSLTQTLIVGGHRMLGANLPFHMASDAGNILSQQGRTMRDDGYAPAAAIYLDLPNGKRKYSLRSIGDFDVAAIAQQYGGGGHKNAASFTIQRGWDDSEV